MKAEGGAKHDRFFDFIPLATKEFKWVPTSKSLTYACLGASFTPL